MSILSTINSPADLKSLNSAELSQLAAEIRNCLIETVSINGGHLAPNLGVVELTIGLHRALDLPKDKIVWDVGHQCYVHKLLTGRREQLATMRCLGGISGFPKRAESPYDAADTGHSSTSISVALGLAGASHMQKQGGTAVAVIGDGALTGGLAYEALNHAGHIERDLIVVLNDNEMSINSNVGAIASYLERLRLDPTMRSMKRRLEEQMKRIPGVGPRLVQMEEWFMDSMARLVVPGLFFEELGFKYLGPIDGHNIEAVSRHVALAKETGGPVLIHCTTKKGHGYQPAEECPEKFHGTSPFNVSSGEPNKAASSPSYTEVFGSALVELAEQRPEICAITAAMSSGTGLAEFEAQYPERFFDVGIAEAHAVTFASGLALGGLRPVVAIYSTFLQRAFDQIMHDVSLGKLPVIFAIDRAGLVGEDGPTHHGAFDISYMMPVPGMTIMAPSDEQELRDMLFTATQIDGMVAIRYPRGTGSGLARGAFSRIPIGKSRIIRSSDRARVALVALGRMVTNASAAAEFLSERGIETTVVDARFAKPLDAALLDNLAASHELIVTLEENALPGGYGGAVCAYYSDQGIPVRQIRMGLPDNFVEHGQIDELFVLCGLNAEAITQRVADALCEIGKSGSLSSNLASAVGQSA